MDISLDTSSGNYQIQAYSNGIVTINNTEYRQPLVVSLERLQQDVIPKQVADLSAENLKELEVQNYEAILLGTGKELTQLSWDLMESAQMMNAPLDIMSTGAACRTFTILASEGRRILAILYP